MRRFDRAVWARRALRIVLGGALAAAGICSSPHSSAAPPSASDSAPAPGQQRLNLLDVVRPEFHDGVMKCVRHPTVATKSSGEEIICTTAVYEWLYDHPDRVALAWQRLKVPTVSIRDIGDGKFAWKDDNGSEVVWQTVGTFPDGRVWYASGKVKISVASPSVPIQATFIVSNARKAEKDGVAVFAPSVQVFVHSDSKAAALALRIAGPAAPRLAEEAASQLIEFFSGIAQVVQKNPTRAELLLGPPRK